MPLQLKIVSENGESLGDDSERLFRENGGTIGRSLENDWILPDPDRFISGRHATLDFKGGAYYLADISTNGVYINSESKPLGRGDPRRLFDGDRLRMGDFEFMVSLDEGEDLAMPPPPPVTVVPDYLEQLVPEQEMRTGIQLLDEEEITGDDEFQSALFGSKPKKTITSSKDSGGSAPNPLEPPPEPALKKAQDARDLMEAFFAGLGIDRSEIHPSTDPRDIMTNAGKLISEFVKGVTELLASRSDVKSTFELDQTTVLPRYNNPMKLAANAEDLIKQLLLGRDGDYLGPVESIRDACRDLKHHQDAMLGGMTEAFLEFSQRFDPDELRENFDRTLTRKPLFSAFNQLKYWQLYCDVYPIMTQQGAGQLPHQFGEEFVRAYEKQIAEYKRLSSGASTVRMTKSQVKKPVHHETELEDQVDHAAEY